MERKFGRGFENYTPEEQRRIALGREVAQEGMVLLENRGALPLKQGARVALFGVGSLGFLHGGSGSGSTFADYVVKMPEAFANAGAVVDETLVSRYTEYCTVQQKLVEKEPPHMRRGTIPEMILPEAVTEAAGEGNDAAVITISRLAGEGRDRKLERGDYYLSDEEHALLRSVRSHFDTMIVLLNLCGTIDMEWVDIYQPDGVLMVWIPGQEGASAAADIVMGHVNPSGRLSDTIAKSWYHIPSSENFGAWCDGYEAYTGTEDQIPYWGGVGNHEMVPVGETVIRPIGGRRYTEYQEGLYVGYRYFSTFGVPVRYPFGYGLSYTTFSASPGDFRQTQEGVSFTVSVENTGKTPGKEVVQIYLHGAESPLERPDRELVAFQKTRLLQPGEHETLHFSIPNRYLAVYSQKQGAWMLQNGENILYLGGNARDNVEFARFFTRETILEQVENHLVLNHTRPFNQLSKRDPQGTRPKAPPICASSGEKHGTMKKNDFVWPQIPQTPGTWTLRDVKEGRVSMKEFLKQAEDFELVVLLIGANLTSITAVETQDRALVEQMPMEPPAKATQLGELTENVPGMSGYTASIQRLGIPTITMSDGPAGIGGGGKPHKLAYPTATITACTFNESLVEALGDALGQEAEERMVDVWLAPAMNIHRNPLAGRNYEYYSEDPLLSGKTGAAMVRGAQRHPLSTCIKHFAANNQETSRWDKDDSVMTERTLREIYLRGFEIVVKEAHPHCVMSAYTPLNGPQTAASRELLTDILRNEWGFQGFVVTDWEGDTGLAVECLQAGNDLLMPGFPGMVDWVYKRTQDGTLSRDVLEACAARLLQVVMNSAAMERYIQA